MMLHLKVSFLELIVMNEKERDNSARTETRYLLNPIGAASSGRSQ